ncbi:MAG: hypothetical protein LBT51_08375, partial [Fusobacteriaceae bacterium]|nr:hypothetical protein [Fusobacteriaceae bacterium]
YGVKKQIDSKQGGFLSGGISLILVWNTEKKEFDWGITIDYEGGIGKQEGVSGGVAGGLYRIQEVEGLAGTGAAHGAGINISEALKTAVKATRAGNLADLIPDNVMGGINIIKDGKGSLGGKFLGAEGYISVSAGEYNSIEYNMFSYTNSKLIYRKDDFDKAFDEAMKHVNHDD